MKNTIKYSIEVEDLCGWKSSLMDFSLDAVQCKSLPLNGYLIILT